MAYVACVAAIKCTSSLPSAEEATPRAGAAASPCGKAVKWKMKLLSFFSIIGALAGWPRRPEVLRVASGTADVFYRKLARGMSGVRWARELRLSAFLR